MQLAKKMESQIPAFEIIDLIFDFADWKSQIHGL